MALALGTLLLWEIGTARAGDINEHAIGDPDAPVTMIEYSSLTCPHCASFHNDVLPELQKRYIDTGKVRMIFRDFPLNEPAVQAAVVAHCAGPERYVGFIDVMFRTQASWSQATDPMNELLQLAKLGGLSEEQVDICMNDADLVDGILKGRLDAHHDHKVQSTPTFVINDEVYPGNRSIEDFARIIEPLLGGAS